LITENRRTTQTEIAVTSVISQEYMCHIIYIRGYRKIYARWVVAWSWRFRWVL